MTKPLVLVALLASAIGLPAAPPMVTVGDTGNPAAPNGRGAVAYEYRIGKFEVTNADYVEFLNAVDPEGTAGEQIYLYSPFYWNLQRIGHLRDGSRAQGDRYYVLPGMADKPAVDIGYLPAVRFVNWLHHGAQRYATSAAGRTAQYCCLSTSQSFLSSSSKLISCLVFSWGISAATSSSPCEVLIFRDLSSRDLRRYPESQTQTHFFLLQGEKGRTAPACVDLMISTLRKKLSVSGLRP
jgi:hypothetical protein